MCALPHPIAVARRPSLAARSRREVTLEGEFQGQTRDPWGGERMGFSASGKINRKDYGLHWNQALDAGGWVLGDDIKMSIEVELVKQK